ncbi:MAG: ribosome small subunit-dependent GTPase A [Clostridia bacterium]|nr:ribosome small subunit-dependent GTPase A [Clostridia bacterium]
MPEGIIIKGIGGFYYVRADGEIYECKARGIFRKEELTPLPGDRVNISIVDLIGKVGSIDEILPRDNHLIRPAVANVNQIAVVVAVKSPQPDFALLDKLLIASETKGIDSFICVNKIDLDENDEYKKITEDYEKANYKVVALSSKNNTGFDQLKDILSNRITVFAGQSGVGKSTILNHVMNAWVMQTGEVSERIERGKHTTRHAELVELDFGGFIVDTPGFSSFELSDIQHNELEIYYPEFEEYINKCRFTGCSHISEPDCSIKEALDNGLIGSGRYGRYVQFYSALKEANKNNWSKNSPKGSNRKIQK